MSKITYAAKLFLKQKIDYILSYQALPVPPNDNDLFLVEFPKSGVTWLSFLIANVFLTTNKSRRRATFFNIEDLIPDVHVRRQIPLNLIDGINFRIIKSHAGYTPCYKKVFYLIRDPRHVMASYHTFLTGLGWYSGSLDQMLQHPRFGIDAWIAHVDGWLTKTSPSVPLVVIRYEDTVADPASQLISIFDFFGWDIDKNVIEQAIEKSSLDNMRASEKSLNSRNPMPGAFSFVRNGVTKTPRVELTKSAHKIIENRAGFLMEKFGYF